MPELECDEVGFRETWRDAISLQGKGIQSAEFAQIQASVTMIHGDHDPHPGLLIYNSLTPFIQNIQYKELQRCGHTPWIEKESMDDFFKLLGACLL